MPLMKDKLIYDPADVADSDEVGVYLKDGAGTALTSTLNGAKQSLDVHISGSGTLSVDPATAASWGIHAEDSAHASGALGSLGLAVRNDAGSVLAGTDGDYIPLSTDSTGALRVAIQSSSSFDFAEDSAHASADIGAFVLAVRQDTLAASTDADGDYAAFKVDANGRLYSTSIVTNTVTVDIGAQSVGALDVEGNVADDAVDSGNPIKIGAVAVGAALSAVSAAGDRTNAVSDMYRRLLINQAANRAVSSTVTAVTATAAVIVATTLAGRTRVIIQNTSSGAVYIGGSGVLTTTGFTIAKGASLELEAGEFVALYVIASGANGDIRVLELA